jgi:hypothetical protein
MVQVQMQIQRVVAAAVEWATLPGELRRAQEEQ